VHQVGFSLHDHIEMHGQQNIENFHMIHKIHADSFPKTITEWFL